MQDYFITNGRRAIDLTGQRFGRLSVLSYLSPDEMAERFPKRRRQGGWLCRCDCGVVKVINSGNIRATKSCGCLNSETAAINGAKNTRLIEDRMQFLAGRVGNYYRTNARRRNFEWSLSVDEVRELILSNCYYCGAEPSNTFNTRNNYNEVETLLHNGIDRIDNNEGYVLKNVVTCCKVCNIAKATMTISEFYTWIQRVYSRIPDPA